MSVLTTCYCGHDLDEHGQDGPMACLEDDCGCSDFKMGATVVQDDADAAAEHLADSLEGR